MRGWTFFAFILFICVNNASAHASYAFQAPAPDVEINLDFLGPIEQPEQGAPDTVQTTSPVDNLPLLKPLRPAAAEQPVSVTEPFEKPPALPSQRPFRLVAPAKLPSIRPQSFPMPPLPDVTAPPERSAEHAPDTTSLFFDGNETELTPAHTDLMQSLMPKASQGRRFQIIGYATGQDGASSSARKISLSRALALRQFFIEHDVDPVDIDVRALGAETDRTPIDRVDIVFY
jgi:outer membrane protein OmpA-like peptidoglycan-associated protein